MKVFDELRTSGKRFLKIIFWIAGKWGKESDWRAKAHRRKGKKWQIHSISFNKLIDQSLSIRPSFLPLRLCALARVNLVSSLRCAAG
jgi:hypothetical protein